MFGKKSSKVMLDQTGRSFVSETMQIEGELHSSGAVDVAGLIDGNVNVQQMTILDTGSVKGDLQANKLDINGHVEGKIVADTVTLGNEAIIKGDIYFKTSLKTEEGAEIDGYIKKTKKLVKEKDEDFDEILEKPELGKPTLVKSSKKEAI